MWREKRGMRCTSVLLCKTSVAGVALSKAIQTCKNLQAAFARSHGFRHCSCLTRKNKSPLHTVCVQRANVSRYHLFLCFFLAYLRDLLTGIGRAGLLSKFSLSVQKLPSIPAFLQIPLSLSGISLWRCPGMYSSFSQPLFFFAIVCIIAEDFSFVKGEFRSLLLRNFLRLFH